MNIQKWKQRKKELGWTHDELAEKSGVSRRTIAGIFSGDPRYESPTYNTIQAIERALGLSEEVTRTPCHLKSLPWRRRSFRRSAPFQTRTSNFF